MEGHTRLIAEDLQLPTYSNETCRYPSPGFERPQPPS
jgi:hypothetical protein